VATGDTIKTKAGIITYKKQTPSFGKWGFIISVWFI